MLNKDKAKLGLSITANPIGYDFAFPKHSRWGYQLGGVTYRPLEGQEPNWFHRLTQRLFLGFKWKIYDL